MEGFVGAGGFMVISYPCCMFSYGFTAKIGCWMGVVLIDAPLESSYQPGWWWKARRVGDHDLRACHLRARHVHVIVLLTSPVSQAACSEDSFVDPHSYLTMTDTAACVECGPNGEQGAIALPSSVPTGPQATQNPLDPATFVPPSASITPSITIEFCDRVSAYIHPCQDFTLK